MNELETIKQDFTALAGPVPQPLVPVAFTVSSQPQRDRANELWLRTQAGLKGLKAKEKEIKDRHKAAQETELAPLNIDRQLLSVMDQALERGIIAYDDAVDKAAKAEQDRLNKLYEKKIDKALQKAEVTGTMPTIAPPPMVPTTQKTQAVEGLGASTKRIDYTYSIPGGCNPSVLRRCDKGAELIPDKYWRLDPPKLHRDDLVPVNITALSAGSGPINIMNYLPASWFSLDLQLINNAVKSSGGNQVIPGVVIHERKSLTGRLA